MAQRGGKPPGGSSKIGYPVNDIHQKVVNLMNELKQQGSTSPGQQTKRRKKKVAKRFKFKWRW